MDRKTTYIRFFGEVSPKTVNALIQTVQQEVGKRTDHLVLLLSSTGGNVFSGVSAYNFLKGIPAEVTTHNFGDVTSVAVLLFCVGTRRFCVPHARFLLHGVGIDMPATRFDEKILDEKIKSLRMDRQTIGRIVADTCGKKVGEVDQSILASTVLDSEQALAYGLVHEIKSDLFPKGVEIINITDA